MIGFALLGRSYDDYGTAGKSLSMKKKYLWWAVAGIGGAAALAAVLWGPIASQVERARYKIVARDRDIEIRDYTPMIVAETRVSGNREEAMQHGFRALADYIFGNNTRRRDDGSGHATGQSGKLAGAVHDARALHDRNPSQAE